MAFRLRKRQGGLDAFIVFGDSSRMLADVQTNDKASGVHMQWFSHHKIKADNCDVIK